MQQDDVSMGKIRNAHKIFVHSTWSKGRSFERPMHKWEGNIKTDFKEKIWGLGLDSCGSGYGPMAGSSKHGNEHSSSIKGWKLLD